MVYDVNGNVICDSSGGGGAFTDEQCKAAFIAYMNTKAELLGMSGTSYASPSGQTQSSYSTPQDALKLGCVFAGHPEGLDIWSTPSQSFPIKGPNARSLSVTYNIGSVLSPEYRCLGGKGGSLIYGSAYHRAQILVADVEGYAVVLSLMALGQTNYNNIYLSAKELCDMVKASINGQTPVAGENLSALISGNGGYAACIIPRVPAAYQNRLTIAELLDRDHSVYDSPSVSRYPASTSKVMTTLCALDYTANEYETILLKTVDIESGSGSTFYDGDVLTVHDALRIMMMESSNTLANAIARTVGRKILSWS